MTRRRTAEPENTDEQRRAFCLTIAAENRADDECWVEMAERAYDFLTNNRPKPVEITDEGGNVVGLFRPE